jgi:two-component system sensor histidine kinase YesM
MEKMKKLLLLYRNSSIRTKMICSFLFVILLTTILITSLSGMMYRNEMISEQNSSLRQMVYQISISVENRIEQIDHVIETLEDDPRVVAYLSQLAGRYDKNLEDQAYRAVFSEANVYPEIAGVMIVTSSDHYVSNVMNRISSEPLVKESWYTQAVQHPDSLQLFSKPVGRNINNIFQYSADEVVSVSKAVIDKKTGTCRGVILVDIHLDAIKSVIEGMNTSNVGFIYIIDSKDQVVYSPINTTVNRIRENWFKGSTGSLIKNIKGVSELLFYYKSSYTQWKTVGVFPLYESQKVETYISYYSYGIALLVMGIAIIISIFFARSVANPITKLRLLMKSAETGNFDVHFLRKYNDEIGQLGESYNSMVDQISELIKTVHIQEKNKRKAEIEILQAQIKPHFLYNTLDTIQWMAQEHDAQDIVDLVGNLTNMLRIVLSKGNEIIPVSMEIKHVESYLMIQKIRYEDKLHYEIYVDDNIKTCSVVKLILQPLVENAIYHGIKEKRGNSLIQILGREEKGKLHFQVIDNGIGMTQEKLEQINRMLNQDSMQDGENKVGYGIFNVNTKIRLNFGDEYGLKFHSVYGEGTVVDLWHPLLTNNSPMLQ